MAGDEEAKPETRWFRRRSPQVQLDKLRVFPNSMSVKTCEETPDVENTDTSVTTVGGSSSSPTSKEKKKKACLTFHQARVMTFSIRANLVFRHGERARTIGGRSFREEGSEGTNKEEGRTGKKKRRQEEKGMKAVEEQRRKKEEEEKRSRGKNKRKGRVSER
ncbi:unnamed protein product [Musa banksii]